MESVYSKFALDGSKILCVRTDTAFYTIPEISNRAVTFTHVLGDALNQINLTWMVC